jgi:uncharacterized protein YlzI (FlbEa/FlbD family)
MNTLRLLASAILYILSGHKIITRSSREMILQKRAEWKMKASIIQKQLDEEHASGKGKMAINGEYKTYEPFTSTSLQRA